MIDKVKRKYYQMFKVRPDSRPYISGDGFRKMADHIFEEDRVINAERVKYKEVVFVQASKLKEYFEHFHPKISAPYLLLSHNADDNITEEYIQYIDDKIIVWFAQNLCCHHEKLLPLPIGLENKYYYNNGVVSRFKKEMHSPTPKKNKIMLGFSFHTNEEIRKPVHEVLKDNPFCIDLKKKMPNKEYLDIFKECKFVVSPDGNGIDCHRTWEAMYLGIVPVLRRSPFSENFSEYPLWLVDDWDELNSWDEKFLEKTYEDVCKKSDEALYLKTWERKIESYRS